MALPHSPPRPLPRQDEPSDAELVARARGEAEAFAVLYRRHYPAIHRYVRRRLGDSGVVDDVVAETFLTALEYLPRYEQRGLPFRAWLYRLATSRIARWLRRARRRLERLEEEPAVETEVDRADRELVRMALLALPERLQSVLALHYLEGLSVEEVSAVLRCAAGTVKSRLSRGRAALRRRLAQLGERR